VVVNSGAHPITSGVNPTIASHDASYNAMGSLARFENKIFYSTRAYYNAGVVAVNLKNRRIGS
jgi:glycerol dehydrogenase-like iron-containing ADH family enzyme